MPNITEQQTNELITLCDTLTQNAIYISRHATTEEAADILTTFKAWAKQSTAYTQQVHNAEQAFLRQTDPEAARPDVAIAQPEIKREKPTR